VVIAAACATDLYGNDGTGLWLTIMAPLAPLGSLTVSPDIARPPSGHDRRLC
jgi:hypothetical protein